MRTVRQLYRMGAGPSSSHTMAPQRAAHQFLQKHPEASAFRVTLYGTLAATGRGHLTDVAIGQVFAGYRFELVWNMAQTLPDHPNGMQLEAVDQQAKVIESIYEYSTGGGALLSDKDAVDTYPEKNLSEIMSCCEANGESFWGYADRLEGDLFQPFLQNVWKTMTAAVARGLEAEGVIPGGLDLQRKAHNYLSKSKILEPDYQSDARLAAFAYAVAEENACGKEVVTAPTCGSSGVLPAVLYELQQKLQCSEQDMINALATAGLFGNVVKHNASISGAYIGCQGEVGTASAMAAAAATQLLGGSRHQIEYAAEMGLEHHFGLTCDPVDGLVQIPCIERNAHGAARAMHCANLALLSDGHHSISFDDAVAVLLETGLALRQPYKETSKGGLAMIYKKRITEQQSDKDML